MSFVVGIRTAGMNEKSSKMTENVIFNGLLEPNSIMVVYLILMEGTGVPGGNHWQNLSYIVVSSTTVHWFLYCEILFSAKFLI